LISDFQVTGSTGSTEAFDQAESNGTPLAIAPINPPQVVKQAMPLDQLIISFAGYPDAAVRHRR